MEKLQSFHKTKQGYLTFGILELILLYVAVTIALDTANMFVYALSIILIVGVITNFTNAVRTHNKKAKTKH